MTKFHIITYALLLISTFVIWPETKADDSPGFFLKITKNVPRLGKRSEKETQFLKNFKTIPRIGRSSSDVKNKEFYAITKWFESDPFDTKSVGKRVLLKSSATSLLGSERDLSVVQPVSSNTLIEMLEKDAIPSDNVKFIHWKDFDRALQVDADLYGKLISLGRKPDQRLKQDLSYGSYIPLFSNTMDVDGTDYMLYNRDGPGELEGQYGGSYYSDRLRYNRV